MTLQKLLGLDLWIKVLNRKGEEEITTMGKWLLDPDNRRRMGL